MKPARLIRCALAALALSLTAGCTTSRAVVPSTTPGTAPSTAGAGVDRASVVSYAAAPPKVRALVDHTGLEPVVESTGARLALGRHVVVAGDVDATDLHQIALLGDLAVDAVDRMDRRSFAGKLLILAPATESDFRAWDGTGYADAWGVTKVMPWHGGPTWVTLHLSAPGISAATLDDDRLLLRRVITHEVFHALTLSPTSRAPKWLTEGFAELAGPTLGPHVVPEHASLPSDAQVHHDPLGYFWAWQFASFLTQHAGRARSMRFYLAAVAPHWHATMNALSRRYLGASLSSLVHSWQHAYRAQGPIDP